MDNLLILCIVIFFVRIIDTSFATVRTVLVIKDKTTLAFVAAFFEVFVWFLIVREALNFEGQSILPIAIAYSLGYATGVRVGMYITDRFITTNVSVNIVVEQKKEIINALIEHNFAVSVSRIKGKDLISNKFMIFVATTNKKLDLLKKIITEIDPHAFIVASENKMVIGGYR
jgi:uncharacterized protein YebE (UPF0316 family)